MKIMSFKDMIKKSVLEGFSSDITTTKICITLLFTVILGIYIFFVYKYKSKTSFYSKEFNIVLAVLPIITAGIVLAMQSNLAISLGMVGALSIVRFRNAVKNPMDLLFLFWSISIGIICGGSIYELAFMLSVTITIVLFAMDFIPNKKESLLLVINSNDIKIEEKIEPILRETSNSYIVKSRAINKNNIDLIFEIRSKNEIEIIEKLSKIENNNFYKI